MFTPPRSPSLLENVALAGNDSHNLFAKRVAGNQELLRWGGGEGAREKGGKCLRQAESLCGEALTLECLR